MYNLIINRPVKKQDKRSTDARTLLGAKLSRWFEMFIVWDMARCGLVQKHKCLQGICFVHHFPENRGSSFFQKLDT
jgi:hypothetical protein